MTAERTQDRALAARCARGDEDAWNELFRDVLPHVLGRLAGFLRQHGRPAPHRDEAEEILADTIGSLVARECAILKSYRGESSLKTWLSVVAVRRGLNYLRTESREHARRTQHSPPLPADQNTRSSDDDTVVREELLEQLDQAAEHLAPRDRQILQLRFVRGLAKAEMADELGVAVNSVGPCVSRAVERLRRAVAEQSGDKSAST